MDEKEARVIARVPAALKQLMQKFIFRNLYLNESDLIRDAIREKIQREAPNLYSQLFKEAAELG